MMTDQEYEVVILGGGPAGLATAIACAQKQTNLAKEQSKICIVEQQPRGHMRVGENIPPETLILLKKLGLEQKFRASDHQPCPGFASVWGKKDVGYNDFIVNPMGHSWRLNRQAFDQDMADRVQALGVNLRWQTRFLRATKPEDGGFLLQLQDKHSSTSTIIKAKFVVDATGSAALFAKHQNSNKHIDDKFVATVRFATVLNQPKGKQVRIEATPNGWCYHSLLPQNRVVSMIVSEQQDIMHLKDNNYQAFEEYLASTQFIGGHLKQMQLVDHQYHSYPIVSGQLSKVQDNDWLAIGDAAASFDPIAAQGIYKALQHGLLAADVITARLTNTHCERDLQTVITNQYQHYLKNRHHMYAMENRWRDTTFWKNRQRGMQTG